MKPSVYLAGPITGLTYQEGRDWRDFAAKYLAEHGIQAYSPLRSKDYLREQGKLLDQYLGLNPLSTAKGIVTRDYKDCTRCDMVLVSVVGAERVSIGTVMEVAWAYAHRVPVVLVIEPDRANPHDHAMFTECCGFRADTLDEALVIIRAVLLP